MKPPRNQMMRQRELAADMCNDELDALTPEKATALIKVLFASDESCRVMVRTLLAINWKCFQVDMKSQFMNLALELAYQYFGDRDYQKRKAKKKGKA